jgi:very-short-patch-repair endonuclease
MSDIPLAWWLIIPVVALAVLLLWRKKTPPPASHIGKYDSHHYLLTRTENYYLDTLREVATSLGMEVSCQVRLADFIRVKRGVDDYQRWFNRIACKSVDFVLVDRVSHKIRVVIELDDSTHELPKRQERDVFVNEILEDVGIGVIRQKVRQEYGVARVREKVLAVVRDSELNGKRLQ